jgi:hypothetical protein
VLSENSIRAGSPTQYYPACTITMSGYDFGKDRAD